MSADGHTVNIDELLTQKYGQPSPFVITFYYRWVEIAVFFFFFFFVSTPSLSWYATPDHDGAWAHWNHKVSDGVKLVMLSISFF